MVSHTFDQIIHLIAMTDIVTGVCPGPMFALLGAGYYAVLIPIIFAILGTLASGVLIDKLPH